MRKRAEGSMRERAEGSPSDPGPLATAAPPGRVSDIRQAERWRVNQAGAEASHAAGPRDARMMSGADCQAVAGSLPGLAETADRGVHGRGGEAMVRAHVATCLRCQAELARYRRTLRAVKALREDRIVPAPGTLASLLAAVERAGLEGPTRLSSAGRRAAYVGGAAMATAAAGAAGVLVWVSRRRVGLAS